MTAVPQAIPARWAPGSPVCCRAGNRAAPRCPAPAPCQRLVSPTAGTPSSACPEPTPAETEDPPPPTLLRVHPGAPPRLCHGWRQGIREPHSKCTMDRDRATGAQEGPGPPSHSLLLSPEPQTHQFCSSSSTSRIPSSSSRTLRRAGNPPCHRPRLRGYPLSQAAPSPRPLRSAVTRAAPGDPPGPGACPEGEVGRDALPTPEEASLPPGLIVSGKGGLDGAGPPPRSPRASCPVQRGGNIGETPNGRGVGWALPSPPGGTPTQKGPSQHQEGKGDLLRVPRPTASGTPGVLGAGTPGDVAPGHRMSCTEKRAGGGGRVQAAPTTLSQVWGTPGMWAGAHLGRFCQAECPVIPQDPRSHRPGVS